MLALLIYCPLLFFGALYSGVRLYRARLSTVPISTRGMALEPALVPVAVSVALLSMATAILYLPFDMMSQVRLTSTMVLAHGYKLYYPPDSGPILNFVYTPLGALFYYPAIWLKSPYACLYAAGILTQLVTLGPAVWLLSRGRSRNDDPCWPTRKLLLCVAAVLGPFVSSPSFTSVYRIHADAPATGFGLLAAAFLFVMDDKLSSRRQLALLWASSFFAIAAPLAKQPMVPTTCVLPILVLVLHGRNAFWRYLAGMAISSAILVGFCCLVCDWRDMVFNTLQVPARHPWVLHLPEIEAPKPVSGLAGNLAALALGLIPLLDYLSPVLILLLFAILLSAHKQFGEETVQSPLARVCQWFRANRWAIFLVCGLAQTSTALLSYAKYGGALTNFGTCIYYCYIAALLLLKKQASETWITHTRNAGIILVALTLALGCLSLRELVRYRYYLDPNLSKTAKVYAFEKAHPGEVYFPMHPLLPLMVEGKLYHFSYGVFDRELAGYPVTDEHVRAHVPPGAKYICIPIPDDPYMEKFPEYKPSKAFPELAPFPVFEREGALP